MNLSGTVVVAGLNDLQIAELLKLRSNHGKGVTLKIEISQLTSQSPEDQRDHSVTIEWIDTAGFQSACDMTGLLSGVPAASRLFVTPAGTVTPKG